MVFHGRAHVCLSSAFLRSSLHDWLTEDNYLEQPTTKFLQRAVSVELHSFQVPHVSLKLSMLGFKLCQRKVTSKRARTVSPRKLLSWWDTVLAGHHLRNCFDVFSLKRLFFELYFHRRLDGWLRSIKRTILKDFTELFPLVLYDVICLLYYIIRSCHLF